jgi:hypothetical protein
MYGGVDVQIHVFLTSALVGGERSASRPAALPAGKGPGTHWIGGWVGPRAGLDAKEKRKFLTLPWLELRPVGRPARSQSTGSYLPYTVSPQLAWLICFEDFYVSWKLFKPNSA